MCLSTDYKEQFEKLLKTNPLVIQKDPNYSDDEKEIADEIDELVLKADQTLGLKNQPKIFVSDDISRDDFFFKRGASINAQEYKNYPKLLAQGLKALILAYTGKGIEESTPQKLEAYIKLTRDNLIHELTHLEKVPQEYQAKCALGVTLGYYAKVVDKKNSDQYRISLHQSPFIGYPSNLPNNIKENIFFAVNDDISRTDQAKLTKLNN